MSRPTAKNKLTRITTFLTDEQMSNIKKTASDLNCSENEIIRDCIDQYFRSESKTEITITKTNKKVVVPKEIKTPTMCNTFFKQ